MHGLLARRRLEDVPSSTNIRAQHEDAREAEGGWAVGACRAASGVCQIEKRIVTIWFSLVFAGVVYGRPVRPSLYTLRGD